MKAAKIAAIVLASLLVLVLAAGAVALRSGFQTWAVRKALAGQPDLNVEVDEVAAGFSAATLRGVRVKQPGMSLAVESVSARYSAWAYLSGARVEVDEARAVPLDERVQQRVTAHVVPGDEVAVQRLGDGEPPDAGIEDPDRGTHQQPPWGIGRAHV